LIPCADPRAGYLARKSELDAAIAQVLESGRYILGENVTAFEEEFSRYTGIDHSVSVANGTDALHIALRASGVGPGDEVVTVSHTAVATIAAIELAGARPVFVDIEPRYFGLDPRQLEAAINSRTKAIIPIHLYGHPVDMDPIWRVARSHGIRVIEDCAQAHGARYSDRHVGAMSDVAAFSFYPTKNLGAFGDGGLVASNDPEIAQRARLLREYGWRERYVSSIAGWNSRLDEIQAAVLRVKLRHLDEDNAKRAGLARLYQKLLSTSGVTLPSERIGSQHVYHLFVVRTRDRDGLQTYLGSQGISALVHYPVPVHLQPAYRGRLAGTAKLNETEAAAREVLSLPLYPELTEANVRRVADAVGSYAATAVRA
jgi:dTDP-4-amino-4,6-dideoxygalactose transaminase